MNSPRLLRGAIGLALLALVITLPGTASADPAAGTAGQRAAALRTQVDTLTITASQATEAYDTAESQLGTLVTQTLLAQQQLDGLGARTSTDQKIERDRARALYMTGGSAGLLSSVLDAPNIEDAELRLHTLQSIVAGDHTRTAASQSATDRAARLQHTLGGLTNHQIGLQKRADQAALDVRAALAERSRLLAQADQQVRVLAARQRAAAAAKAAAAFQAQVSGPVPAGGTALLDGSRPSDGPGRPGGSDGATRPGGGDAGSHVGTSSDGGSHVGTSGGGGSHVGTSGNAPTAPATAAIVAARGVLGVPYVWGATGPDAFDCSGLTGWAYRQAGVDLPRTAREQWTVGRHVDLAELAPGDLLFWATDTADPATIHHVGLYLGDGTMIAAPDTGDVVKIQAVYLTGYIGAVRPVG